ncbi:glycosyltransferase family 2 protein [Paraburkholderia sp.]|uniref:glycosyltransferase family 2 protein n=1 Tax=Paraburkholderia sp. TaxID=1926495 RepID=UPI0023A2A6DF|nr:glycosyltransferase family 2 protein [Paraburkholderia sp.]MDE1183020.1 glycosyltransferase family 2 protein [Paraburkholderia sp.]
MTTSIDSAAPAASIGARSDASPDTSAERFADVRPMRVAVVIATKGRPTAIPKALEFLARQTVRPDLVVLSATCEADIAPWTCDELDVRSIYGSAGSSAQRNRGLDTLDRLDSLGQGFDVVIFFDDDFAPCRDWVARCAQAFERNPSLLGMSGRTLRDGAATEPVSWDEALNITSEADTGTAPAAALTPCSSLYGCNMAVRLSAIGSARFDERLVLYGWLEDKDFSRRVAAGGALAICDALRGVHLGLVGGRVSGKKFGYSQVVNADYLRRKGVMSRKEAASNIARALIMNSLKSIRPEAHLDRRGRLIGNVIGVAAICFGSGNPERAARL